MESVDSSTWKHGVLCIEMYYLSVPKGEGDEWLPRKYFWLLMH